MAKHQYTDEEIAEWRKGHRGMLYFNTDDTNFMVPKAYGFGRTFNWANPISWVIGAILAAVIIYALFFRRQGLFQ